MQRDCKRKLPQRKTESCEKRSPLQNLNGLPFRNKISAELPKISSVSSSSSSSSYSRFNLDNKSKSLARREPSRSAADASKVLSRSEGNEVSRKPILGKIEPQLISRRANGKAFRNPVSANGRRSKLSSVQNNQLKKGSQEFQAKMKNSRENGSGKRAADPLVMSNSIDLNCSENCTPVGRVDSEIGNSIFETANGANSGSSDVKTPPVVASLSPEIHCNSHSKLLVLKSAATPVCYGAGHLVSGVTDKRKCRRRGSLRGGSEKVILFDDGKGDEQVSTDRKESPVPLPAEASLRWHSSPSNEGCEDQEIDSLSRLNQCRMVCDDRESEFDTLCGEYSYSGSDSVGSKRRNLNVVLSNRKATDQFEGLLEASSVVESLVVTSPIAAYNGNSIGIRSREEMHLSEDHIVGDSKLSSGSLSSGNIIQTLDTDDSDVCVGRSRLGAHRSNLIWSDLDSITETLGRVNLSPRNEGFPYPDMASDEPNQLGKNTDSVSSWVSDTTFSNVSLSQMMVSWRDGSLSKTDESEWCCVLSDDEINGGKRGACYVEIESGEVKGDDLRTGDDVDVSPVRLDYEPCIRSKGKERSLSRRSNRCAESICTDGGGLVASGDSDWTYFHEDGLFQLK